MKPLEAAGVVLNLLSVGLTAVKNIWLWPTGIAGCAVAFVIFYEAKLYADALLQIFFVVLSVYGWWKWVNGGTPGADAAESVELPVSRIPKTETAALSALVVLSIGVMGYLFDKHTDAALPYWDSTITVWSIAAQWMLARKYLENWLVWIAVDVISIGVYWFKDLLLWSGLYVVFLCIAIAGYFAWRRDVQRVSNQI